MYVGLYVFSWPVPLVMIQRIYILCVIVIIKSEVWTITHCLGLGHETRVPTVCLSIFLETAMESQFKNVGNQFDNITSLNTIFRTTWNYRFKITKKTAIKVDLMCKPCCVYCNLSFLWNNRYDMWPKIGMLHLWLVFKKRLYKYFYTWWVCSNCHSRSGTPQGN